MKIGLFDPEERFGKDGLDRTPEGLEIVNLNDASGAVNRDPELTYVVPVGDAALLSIFRAETDSPLLPVAVDAGVPSVNERSFEPALESLARGEVESTEIPTIGVSLNGRTYRALMDVMAVTAEPARISEFRTIGSDGRVVDTVRADGIVVSGPGGTPGYGTAVGGPILDPAVKGLAVVPVGQFRTARPRWVLAPPVEIEVVRDIVPIALVVDDREVETVPVDTTLRLTWGQTVEFGVLEQSTLPPV